MATTPNLGLTKPTVGADNNAWGTELNSDLDTIDGLFPSGALGIANGGTGGTTAAAAKTALGIVGGNLPGGVGGATVLGGKIGETDVATNSGFSAANGVPSNITSATLTAGTYVISAYVGITPAGGAATYLSGGITTTSATLPVGVQASFTDGSQTFPTGVFQQRPTGEAYVNISTPTTIYLVGQASFAGTCTMSGGLRWRRI